MKWFCYEFTNAHRLFSVGLGFRPYVRLNFAVWRWSLGVEFR